MKRFYELMQIKRTFNEVLNFSASKVVGPTGSMMVDIVDHCVVRTGIMNNLIHDNTFFNNHVVIEASFLELSHVNRTVVRGSMVCGHVVTVVTVVSIDVMFFMEDLMKRGDVKPCVEETSDDSTCERSEYVDPDELSSVLVVIRPPRLEIEGSRSGRVEAAT